MFKSISLQGLLKKLSRCTYVKANTENFKGNFKFSKVRGFTSKENKDILFFYDEKFHLLFTCDTYYISKIKDSTIYINC